MAAIARRTWAQLRDEAIAAAGGHTYTGFSSRMEYWLTEAYYDLATSYHHHELEAVATPAAMTPGTATLTIPTDAFIIITFVLKASVADGGAYLATLRYERLHWIQAAYSSTSAQPSAFARSGSTFYFNCPPDKAYTSSVYYYKVPAAPDFSSGSPATAWLWDTHLIEGALAKCQGRVWRPDLVQLTLQPLNQWLQAQVQPTLTQELQTGLPDYPNSNAPQGGPQG